MSRIPRQATADSDRDIAADAAAASRRGNKAEAERILRAGLKRFPKSCTLLVRLGNLDLARGQAERAETRYRRALRIRPNDVIALGALSRVLLKQARFDETIAVCRAALEIAPNLAEVWNDLGIAFREIGDVENAVGAYDRAVALAPDVPVFWYNRANALLFLGDWDSAIASYDKAHADDPESPARLFKSAALLLKGDLAAGWDLNECRFATHGAATPDRTAPFPRWNGEDLASKTIVVWGEQGIGDEIRFLTCLPDLIARAGRVIYDCEPRLETLARRSFPDVEVRTSPPKSTTVEGPADFHVPVGSLPRHFRRSMEEFGTPAPILTPDGRAVAHWREWLGSLGPGAKVGVSWRAAERDAHERQRSAPLSSWGNVLHTPGARFVCLQNDDCAGEIAEVARDLGVTIHLPPDLDRSDDFDNLAALATALDFVVSWPDTVADLAGAVGTRTLVVAHGPDRPWGIWPGAATGGQRWYPDLTILSARTLGGWQEALDEAARRLAAGCRELSA